MIDFPREYPSNNERSNSPRDLVARAVERGLIRYAESAQLPPKPKRSQSDRFPKYDPCKLAAYGQDAAAWGTVLAMLDGAQDVVLNRLEIIQLTHASRSRLWAATKRGGRLKPCFRDSHGRPLFRVTRLREIIQSIHPELFPTEL